MTSRMINEENLEYILALPAKHSRTRSVYIDRDWVYKRPVEQKDWDKEYWGHYGNWRHLNQEGRQANLREAEAYQNQMVSDESPSALTPRIAECYMLSDEVTLKMRKVDVLCDSCMFEGTYDETRFRKIYKYLPIWVESVDSYQVGYDHEGNLVAFDL